MKRLAAIAIALVLLPSVPAHAQMDPQRCQNAANGDSGLGGGGSSGGGMGGGGGGSWGGESTTTTTMLGEDREHGLCATLLETFAPGDNPGPHPTSHYDLGYDQGGTFSAWRKISGFLMDGVFFTAAKWVVRIGLGIANWAMEFGFADRLAPAASRVADGYQQQVIGRIGLAPLFLSLAALWGGWLALSGKMMRGGAEFGVSVLIAAVAATFWANPADRLLDGLEFTSGFGFEVAAVTAGQDVQTPERNRSVAAPMASAIHHAFVEVPHEYLNWGRGIPAGDQCRPVYEQAVATGPWGPADEPRDAMKAAGCRTEAAFNHDPTADRVLASLLVMIGGVLIVVVLATVAVTLIAAQVALAVAIALAPFAFLFGTLPGRGRTLFWRWVAFVASALCGVLMMAVILSLLLVGTSAILDATQGMGVLLQMLMVDILAVYVLAKRRHLVASGRRATNTFAARMAGAQVGGGGMSRGRVSFGESAAVGAGVGATLASGRRNVSQAWDKHHRRGYQRDMRRSNVDRAGQGGDLTRSVDKLTDAMHEQAPVTTTTVL